MWSKEHEQGAEVRKIVWELVPYMRGTCVDLGCGPYKAFPHFIGVDNCKDTELFGIQMKPNIRADVTSLHMFASGYFDCVFSSHTLEHIEDYKGALKEWWRLVKPGGYLILYLPHKDFYPNIGVEDANQDHKHDFIPSDILEAVKEIATGFDLLENSERNEGKEYSFFQVYQKTQKRGHEESWKKPKPEKTCAVVRYGAIGDNIQTSSIFPWLKEQGYHLTVYCQSGPGYEVLKHDPHIDKFIIQDKDAVPQDYLIEFWDYTAKKYDKWVNLSESVEGTLLAFPGRTNHYWANHIRAKYLDRNYSEWVHELAGVPLPLKPKFYSTLEEKAWARKTANQWGKRNILWSLSGSSVHKSWPHLDVMVARIMLKYKDVHVVFVGDEFCKLLEQGWEKEPRCHLKSGEWSIRQSMAFAEVADLIIGTETGLLNAAGSMDADKIVTLSHSSEEMLTKHWKKVIPLKQETVGCPKQPCRQLHYGWDHCMKHEETGTAMCQFHIGPEQMWAAISGVLNG